MRIPFSVPSISESDIAAVTDVLKSGWLTTGPVTAEFERDLQDLTGAPYAVCTSSATAAQTIAMAYLGVGPGWRVAVPTWTFASTGSCVLHAGAELVLVDVDPDSLNMNPRSLEGALAEGLDLVIPVHFGGVPVAEEIHDLCASRGVPILEDAAHAIGASDHRGPISGKDSTAAFHSFYATKNLPIGEGGAILTHDEKMAVFARSYRLHGMTATAEDRYRRPGHATYDITVPGIKANLPDVLAALGRSQLTRFAATQELRRKRTTEYREQLAGGDYRVVPSLPVEGSADHLMVVECPTHASQRDAIARLTSRGIGSSVHFTPLHILTAFRDVSVAPGGLPIADDLAGRVLSLPLSGGISAGEVQEVTATLLDG